MTQSMIHLGYSPSDFVLSRFWEKMIYFLWNFFRPRKYRQKSEIDGSRFSLLSLNESIDSERRLFFSIVLCFMIYQIFRGNNGRRTSILSWKTSILRWRSDGIPSIRIIYRGKWEVDCRLSKLRSNRRCDCIWGSCLSQS